MPTTIAPPPAVDGEQPLSLDDAATAAKCSVKSLKKWMYFGLAQRGGTGRVVKLESVFWMNRRWVSVEAIARFRDAIQNPAEAEKVDTPAGIRRRVKAARKMMREVQAAVG